MVVIYLLIIFIYTLMCSIIFQQFRKTVNVNYKGKQRQVGIFLVKMNILTTTCYSHYSLLNGGTARNVRQCLVALPLLAHWLMVFGTLNLACTQSATWKLLKFSSVYKLWCWLRVPSIINNRHQAFARYYSLQG